MSRKAERWAREEAVHQEHEAALTEIQRLRTIIKTAYSSQGWDIGSMKNLLIPGLEGYENSGWANYLTPLDDSFERAQADLAKVLAPPASVFGAAEYEVGFDETSDRDSWWITLSLMGDHGERGTYTLTDIETFALIQRLRDQIAEGRKRFNE